MEKAMKRLLSLAVALVMILCMIPVFQLQAKADGESAWDAYDWATINRGNDALNDSTIGTTTESVSAVCPFCGGAAKTWHNVAADSAFKGTHNFVPAGTSVTASLDASTVANRCFYMAEGSTMTGTVKVSADGGKLKIFGKGTIDNGAARIMNTSGAGELIIGGCTINGGSYPATTAAARGAAILNKGTNITLTGEAVIEGGVSGNNGGNIINEGTGVLTVSGNAQVRGGQAANGGNIYVAAGTVTVSGNAVISGGIATANGGNIHAAAGAFAITGSTAENATGVQITGGTATTNGGNINTAVALNITNATISGGSGATGGNIFTNAETTIGSGAVLEKGIATGESGRGGSVFFRNNLTIEDGSKILGGFPTGSEAEVNAAEGGLLYSDRSVTLTVNGGTIGCEIDGEGNVIANPGKVSGQGGNICMIRDSGTVDANLIINGGTVYGGEALGGNSVGFGGNVYARGNVAVLVQGGTVTAGQANRGGNFLVQNGADLSIGGGENTATVSDGISSTHGGNIYVYQKNPDGAATTAGCQINLGANGVISGGDANNYGGNIAVFGSDGLENTLSMTGGEISGGKSQTNGGNVYMGTNVQFTMDDGAIFNGESVTSGGGNVYLGTNCTFTMNDGEIYNGLCRTYGGNVYAYNNSVFNMNGGTVKDGVLEQAIVDDPETDEVEEGTENVPYNILVVTSEMNYVGGDVSNGKIVASGADAFVRLYNNASPAENALVTPYDGGQLQIVENYAGTAYVYGDQTLTQYAYGTTIEDVFVGTVTDGIFTPSDASFIGKLYWRGVAAVAGDPTMGLVGDGTGAVKIADIQIKDLETGKNVIWVTNLEDYDAATQYVRFMTGTEHEITGPIVVDINGKDMTFTGTGDLSVINTHASKAGSVTANGPTLLTAPVMAGGNNYIVVGNSVYSIKVAFKTVMLRTAAADGPGFYLKAVYEFSDVIQNKIDAYGIALNKLEAPTVDFANQSGQYTEVAGAPESGATTNSGYLGGFFTDNGSVKSAADKKAAGETVVYAAPYITVDGEILLGSVATISLKDVFNAIETHWEAFAGQQDTLTNFYNTWCSDITDWTFPNLSGAQVAD